MNPKTKEDFDLLYAHLESKFVYLHLCWEGMLTKKGSRFHIFSHNDIFSAKTPRSD